jgi:hypothetical protein
MINQRAKFRQHDNRVTTNQLHNTSTILRHVPVLRDHKTVSSTRHKRPGFVSIRIKRQMQKGSKIPQKLDHDMKCVGYTYLINIFPATILFIPTALTSKFIFTDGNPLLHSKSNYPYSKNAQIAGAWSPWRLNCKRQCLIFMSLQFES